ncbi:hypothetical protein Q7C36_007801 [Tachysurus vachellii]|uniref:Uncharacterized protein n=1 Tax=Tachysurus vachellii TaxID=175792 RepID=A0AA88SXN2_TACVA|nr:hypothetical protein Q7C36_007801 [Tachysurus vachellii]
MPPLSGRRNSQWDRSPSGARILRTETRAHSFENGARRVRAASHLQSPIRAHRRSCARTNKALVSHVSENSISDVLHPLKKILRSSSYNVACCGSPRWCRSRSQGTS